MLWVKLWLQSQAKQHKQPENAAIAAFFYNIKYDDIYCTNKIYASADADLNKNYQQLRQQLNETQQKILKKAQLVWIRHRDASCTDSQQNSVDVQCRLTTTQERNHWLLERLRECQTVGCKTTRLSE